MKMKTKTQACSNQANTVRYHRFGRKMPCDNILLFFFVCVCRIGVSANIWDRVFANLLENCVTEYDIVIIVAIVFAS